MNFISPAFHIKFNGLTTALFICCLFFSFAAVAQQVPVSLAIKNEGNLNLSESIKKLNHTANYDTARVNLMLRISRVYWLGKTNANRWLDSCGIMAGKARILSSSLHDSDGFAEATFILTRQFLEKEDVKSARALLPSVTGDARVRQLLIICEHFIFKLGADNSYLDQCYPDLLAAEHLSEEVHSTRWLYECKLLEGKYFFKRGNFEKGKVAILQIINSCEKQGDVAGMAHYWSELGLYMPENDSTYRDKINSHAMAVKYYLQLKNVEEAAYSLRDQAILNAGHNLVLALNQMLNVIDMLKSSNIPVSFTTYRLLADFYRARGEFEKAMTYAQMAVNNPNQTNYQRSTGYSTIASIYQEMGRDAESLPYFQKAYDYSAITDQPILYFLAFHVGQELAITGRPQDALNFLNNVVKQHPPVLAVHKQALLTAYGTAYKYLKNYKKAEECYLEMIELNKTIREESRRDLSGRPGLSENTVEFDIGRFYVQRGRYAEAKPHLEKALLPPKLSPLNLSDIYYLLFQVDSANRDYPTAIKQLQQYMTFNDSLYTLAKSRAVEEINIKYQTATKEQAIKTLEAREQQAYLERKIQDAKLVKVELERKNQEAALREANLVQQNQQAALKAAGLVRNNQQVELQKVNLQRKYQQTQLTQAVLQRDIQQVELSRLNFQRNITMIGVGLLLCVLFLAYNGYRHKNKSNRQLQIQKIEINDQKLALESLLTDKDHLLTEKDWLLKEVHHRVKNNLQIVMSLLSTQSAYLENKAARNAIQESQNRVSAIAIIHQKLYGAGNNSTVKMDSYITDLAVNLADSFDTGKRRISFIRNIDYVEVDIVQAVPLGLMLNEAITNAIKYAFDDHGGTINITLKHLVGGEISMCVSDTGKGFPLNFDIAQANSLGMEMMKALSIQLKGKLQLYNDNGAVIRIRFLLENIKHNEYAINA